ncbi:MAG: Zn-ribbon domain-containing OB-fold protein [Thermodesulfobacteriota bacterium]
MRPKPVPIANADTRPFWEACNRNELIYQHCLSCGKAQFYPRALCAVCGAGTLEWRISKGLGTVHTFTINYRPPDDTFASDVPYIISLVDMDEGFRMMLNIQECPPEAVRIGMRIRVIFESREGQKIPQGTPSTKIYSSKTKSFPSQKG